MWTTAGGGEDDEAQRHREMVWRRRQRPEHELPGSLAIDAVLVGNDEVVVFMSGVRAFSNGVELTLEVRARHTSTDERGDTFGLHGHAGRGDPLLLGIELSDGRRCTNLDGLDLASDPSERPMLTPGGGSSTARSADLTLFLSPLPPPGDLRVVCAWPRRGLAETITVLSADDILDAAQRARVLWPWEPEPEPVWSVKPPEVPRGGWFAEQQAQDHEPQQGPTDMGKTRERLRSTDESDLFGLREGAENGDRDAVDQLIELAGERGDLDELRRFADQGNTTASDQLIELASEQGNLEELRRLADQGNTTASDQLIELASEQGNLEELRRLADQGDTTAREVLEELEE
jgi:hypothetical protein